MRLVTLRTADGTRAGRLDGDEIVEIDAPDVGTLLADRQWRQRAAAADGPTKASRPAKTVPETK